MASFRSQIFRFGFTGLLFFLPLEGRAGALAGSNKNGLVKVGTSATALPQKNNPSAEIKSIFTKISRGGGTDLLKGTTITFFWSGDFYHFTTNEHHSLEEIEKLSQARLKIFCRKQRLKKHQFLRFTIYLNDQNQKQTIRESVACLSSELIGPLAQPPKKGMCRNELGAWVVPVCSEYSSDRNLQATAIYNQGLMAGIGVLGAATDICQPCTKIRRELPTGGSRCNAPETPILTPSGWINIKELKVGDFVFSLVDGKPQVVPIRKIYSVRVELNHQILRIVLRGGKTLRISPEHPQINGQALSELRAGDRVKEIQIESISAETFGEPTTYDILPESDSGTYSAGGLWIGSTLR